MNLQEYGEGCRQTESKIILAEVDESGCFEQEINARLLHGAMGLCTEAGELLDTLKKHIFYRQPLDHAAMVNLLEETGDALYYIFGILLDEIGKELNLSDPANSCFVGNIAKLAARYGDKFSSFKATHRDVVSEIQALESAGGVK